MGQEEYLICLHNFKIFRVRDVATAVILYYVVLTMC